MNKNNSCKVFDPSCGSGIFLVETLRSIIEKNLKQKKLNHEELKEVVENNIFGVDKNKVALNLTIFSLCLTLLDYIEPKDITNFRFPKLLNKNLFEDNFFNLKGDFNKIKDKNLDFILGNPPWGSDKEESHLEYIEGIKKIEKEKIINDYQIAQTFAIRAKDFSSENKNIKCALVLHSKILYNHNAYKFRKYWLENFKITEVLELSPVRRFIFANADAPAAIAFYQYAHGKDTKNSIVKHTSIKPNIFLKYLKLLVIEKNDIKEIKQEYFQKYDWLWKVMLYGNVFDFYFIKRLKDDYRTVKDYINEFNIIFGSGFISAEKNSKKREELKNKIFVDSNDFKVSQSFRQNFNFKKIIESYPNLFFKDQGILNSYKSPHLLLKRSLKNKPTVTYLEKECAFPNTIFGIHGENKTDLKAIGAYFSSVLAQYLLFLISSNWGVTQEEVLQEDYKNLPCLFDKKIKDNLAQVFDELINISKNKYSKKILDNTDYEKLIKEKIKKIDLFLSEKLELSEQEQRLIDYNVNISIPLFFGEKKSIDRCTPAQLENYAQIFLDHFGARWNGNPDFFEVDIYSNKYIVGMNFKVVKEKRDDAIKKADNIKELFKLMKLGEEKITDEFYEQRDIKGFNPTSFYVVKSNQYKNWHPAVAQADLHEFIEAMLDAGRRHLIERAD